MITSRAFLYGPSSQKFLRPLKAFSCVLCTYTRTRSRSITSPHPYLVPSWNDPRVARKFDKLCLQMFILTRSTKRDVASTSYSFPSPHPSDTMKFTCWQSMKSTLPASWRNFGDSSWLSLSLSSASTFRLTLELDIRFFIMDVLDAPIRFDRSSIKTVFQPYSDRHALPSLKHVCAFKPSKYRRTITMQK